MKKIAFALQVFGLIAILPICVVLEMNHAGRLPVNNTHSKVNQDVSEFTVQKSLITKEQDQHPMTGKMLLFLQADMVWTKQ